MAVGIVAQAGFFDSLVLELELTEQLGVMNEEDGASVGNFGTRGEFEEPFRGFEFFGVMPELPCGDYFQGQVAGAADLKERVTSDRIDWLDSAVQQRRQAGELAHMEFAILFRGHDGDDFAREQSDKEPRQDFQKQFHAVLLFQVKPSRWVTNWTTNPRPTSTQEKYGVSQLGLWTTCKIVPPSSGSKLAW